MKHTLVQVSIGKYYDNMLAVTDKSHREYCVKHNIGFLIQKEQIGTLPMVCTKVEYITHWLSTAADGDVLVLADADILIRTKENIITDWFPEPYSFGWAAYPDFHYTGIYWVRCNSESKIFFTKMVECLYAVANVVGHFCENAVIETLLQTQYAPKHLLLLSNAYHDFSPDSAIQGWHGMDNRDMLMANALRVE